MSNTRKATARNAGFTLVELSIVLVIIGLIIGSILVGRELIRTSELRKIASEFEKYETAINSFRGKYRGYPGDYRKAVIHLGATTADGNGNGKVEDASVGPPYEFMLVWEHLALAGMVGGDFDGSTPPVLGVNTPASKAFENGGYSFFFESVPVYQDKQGHMLEIGGAGIAQYQDGPLLSPEDAYRLDVMMDDGAADSGRIWALNGWPQATYSNCVSGDVNAAKPVTYTLASTDRHCTVYFWYD